jgi:glycosyltransferase involved in cell wall biosynthesis
MPVHSSPLVSIIMPAFMAENWIDRAIRSVLEQTHIVWELVIVDDGSSDATGSIATAYSMADERIRYYFTPNYGVSHARNYALDKSKGSHIAYLDADDEYLPNHLQVRLQQLEKTGCPFVFGPVFERRDGQSFVFHGRLDDSDEECVLPLMVMHTRNCLDVGDFDVNVSFEEDLDLWHRMAQRHRIASFDSPVTAVYSVHSQGMHVLHANGGTEAIQRFRNDNKRE